MNQQIDPKELKTLSDILALVLDEQPGQAVNAIEALRVRARRNAITGGALKNLFIAIAPNPPQKAAPRPRASRASSSAEMQAARVRISQLTADVNKLDLDLRGANARVEALRSELHLTRQARAEAQQALHSVGGGGGPRQLMLVGVALFSLLIGIAGTSAVMMLTRSDPPPDQAALLHQLQ